MKKFFAYVVISLLFVSMFGIAIQSVSNNVKDDAPVISGALDFISPAVAYADSDTVDGPGPVVPPPPID
jgi:hypothetical protein